MHVSHSNKTLQALGKLLMIRHPQVAKDLYDSYLADQPTDSDYTRIGCYYQKFCGIMGIHEDHCRGALFKHSRSELRRLFISCMLRLYNPAVYRQPDSCLINPQGLVKQLAEVLCVAAPRVSEAIRQAVAEERIYERYREKVDKIVERIKANSYGS